MNEPYNNRLLFLPAIFTSLKISTGQEKPARPFDDKTLGNSFGNMMFSGSTRDCGSRNPGSIPGGGKRKIFRKALVFCLFGLTNGRNTVGLGRVLSLGWREHLNRTWQAHSKSIFVVVNSSWSTAIYGEVDFLDTVQRSRPPWPLEREFFQSALYLSAYKIRLRMCISSQPTHPCTVTIFTLRPYLCSLGLKSSTICICTLWNIQQQPQSRQQQPTTNKQPSNLLWQQAT